ncbi:MAG: DegV family protein, partial [Clostridia bacterium]|nr:DegV family protein [Clostridia bacterium]
MAVKILVDSASDIDAEEAQELGIELLPMEVEIQGKKYLDGVEIKPKQFFEKLIESTELPRTSQINPYRFEEKFEELTGQGYDVVAITISSKLSGTYSGAANVAKKFAGKVFAVDSLNASIGEKILCYYALRLLEQGASAQEIASELNKVRGRINVLARLDTLQYLKKGGRISAVTAFAGQMLSIKPVIGVIGGEVKMVGKAIGSKKGNNLLNSLVEKKGVDFDMPFVVGYGGLD